MLVEAEKSVFKRTQCLEKIILQLALCGSNLTDYQRGMILMLGVREVIIALINSLRMLIQKSVRSGLNT